MYEKADALGLARRIDPVPGGIRMSLDQLFRSGGGSLGPRRGLRILELRERLRPVVTVLAAKGELEMMLVSNSKYNDPMIAVWRAMTATDATYPSNLGSTA